MEPIWVHLDLKGAPPTVDYLLALFPLLKRWGATGLLIEWEDMLPWQSPLDVVRHRDSFTADEVRQNKLREWVVVTTDQVYRCGACYDAGEHLA